MAFWRRGPNPRPQQLGHSRETADDYAPAGAILSAWQAAEFRGYTVIEKRRDRRFVVLSLLAQLKVQQLTLAGQLIAADEVARDQWRDLLLRNGQPLEGWVIQTADDLIADDNYGRQACIVVADELEAYLSEDFAAALVGLRGIIGLCASPGRLDDAQKLRKYIGGALDLSRPSTPLDLTPLTINSTREADADRGDPGDVRERLVTVKDPDNLLAYYLTEIQKRPLLTAVEEIQLAKQIEVGLAAQARKNGLLKTRRKPRPIDEAALDILIAEGRAAKDRFITCNLRLVYNIARRYIRMETLDAIQEGNRGLIRAVEKFDYTKGFKFSTYATWWIRQSITRAIPDQTFLIRIPVHLYESDSPILTELRSRLDGGEHCSAREIAYHLSLPVKQVESALARHKPPYCLELMTEVGFDVYDPDDPDVVEQVHCSLLPDEVQAVLETLSEREAGVLRLRFGLADGQPRTLDEIGQVFGVTRERIRQIETETIEKLRETARSEHLRGYFEEL